MRVRLRLLITPSLAAVCLACSPHEFNDPTGATSKVLFQQTPGSPAPASTPTPTAPPASPPVPTAPGPVAPTRSRDVVELTTGERIEGTVVQTTASEVVIEVGGTEVRLARDRVNAVFYGRR